MARSRRPDRRRTPSGRPVAAGGWQRALIGVAVGVAAGLLALLGRQRDEG